MNKPRLMQGNEAVAEGALAAGVLFYAGYPTLPLPKSLRKWRKNYPQSGGLLFNRKGPAVAPRDYIPYENNESMIPAMANFGDGYRYQSCHRFNTQRKRNRGQLASEIERIFGYKTVERLNRTDGELITPNEVLERIGEVK